MASAILAKRFVTLAIAILFAHAVNPRPLRPGILGHFTGLHLQFFTGLHFAPDEKVPELRME